MVNGKNVSMFASYPQSAAWEVAHTFVALLFLRPFSWPDGMDAQAARSQATALVKVLRLVGEIEEARRLQNREQNRVWKKLPIDTARQAAGAAEAAAAHVRLVVERLVLVNRQLDHARRQLDRLVRQLAEPASADDPDASAGAEPWLSKAPLDAAILLSLPGIGTGVLATLLAEGSDAVRRRDYNALRCLCGVAPVTRRSGKSLLVTRRLAAHNRLRDAAYHWARVAAQDDPVSHAKYQALRARGHGHALRSVADRLLNVACAMLRNGTCFDRHRAGTATA